MKNSNKEQLESLPLADHLRELRNRVIFSLLFFITAFGFCYFFSDKIYEFLLQPLIKSYEINKQGSHRVIYTNPSEAFFTYLKLSSYAALFFSIPVFAIQIYMFFSPALYKKEKKAMLSILFFAPSLFLTGAILAYQFIIPITIKFFLSFESSAGANLPIQLETKISEYLSLVLNLLFGFGIAFEMPLLLVFLVKIGILSTKTLKKSRRYWVVCIFIISGFLTPPDVISQTILAVIMLILFEVVILICDRLYKTNKED